MFFVIILISGVITFLVGLYFRTFANGKPKIQVFESERFFTQPSTGKRLPFPPLMKEEGKDSGELYLSLVVPAYNEEQRLPEMLDEALGYMEKRSQSENEPIETLQDSSDVNDQSDNWGPPTGKDFTYEVIIVDDGSTDQTTDVALKYSEKYGVDKVRVLTLEKNRGKGGAVRLGVLSSRGRFILFADADGATRFADIEKLENFLYKSTNNYYDILSSISLGSRAHLEKQAIATRSIFRTFLMLGFHFIVWFFTVRSVHDTQCGFKMFGRSIARLLFNHMHVEKWAFDVELLYLAEKVNSNIGETAVNWTEIDGSKVTPVISWLQMGRDVISIPIMYNLGAWKAPAKTRVKNFDTPKSE